MRAVGGWWADWEGSRADTVDKEGPREGEGSQDDCSSPGEDSGTSFSVRISPTPAGGAACPSCALSAPPLERPQGSAQ